MKLFTTNLEWITLDCMCNSYFLLVPILEHIGNKQNCQYLPARQTYVYWKHSVALQESATTFGSTEQMNKKKRYNKNN